MSVLKSVVPAAAVLAVAAGLGVAAATAEFPLIDSSTVEIEVHTTATDLFSQDQFPCAEDEALMYHQSFGADSVGCVHLDAVGGVR